MSNIKPGDLVMVVKPVGCGCAKSYTNVGKIFTVTEITKCAATCYWCKKLHGLGTISVKDADAGYIQLSRLIKIDPPKLPEEITEDLHETA